MEEAEARSSRGGAEAVLNMKPNSSMSIAYHSLFGPHDDFILLELDPSLIPDVLHQRMTLRGQPDEDAVLCTQRKTFGIKFVGTSNSVLLVPPSSSSSNCDYVDEFTDSTEHGNKLPIASVLKVSPGTLVLVEVAPRLDKLKLLLLERPYRFEDAMEVDEMDQLEEKRMGFFKWDDLVRCVQASDDELREGLRAIHAVEIDGYWRIVDEAYMGDVLNMLLHNLVLNDWSLDALVEDEVVGVLVYGSKVGDGVGGCRWKLDEKRVCVHFARVVLREGKKRMESFMEVWLQKVPDGMSASFEMLKGEVLTERIAAEIWVHTFSVSSLPLNPADRFSAPFSKRPKWEWKDLEPFLKFIIRICEYQAFLRKVCYSSTLEDHSQPRILSQFSVQDNINKVHQDDAAILGIGIKSNNS
ncbi:Sister chromatid cohesion protein Dcc1 [Dillenia turbinata]|uniref:Sister chromatid cohesion protein Dcc1 n=1 Tax=Dillenia turbinata TaxID=194707 RepID=A0AAN8UMX2_9MAGN